MTSTENAETAGTAKTTTSEPRLFDVLITADEAYPRFEQEVLKTRHDIVAGFRVFDPMTKLRSSDAQKIGETWFDLIIHTLNRGVRIHLILTDFDPVARMAMHVQAWRHCKQLIAAGEASRRPELLTVEVHMHPARIGAIPRTLLWPRSVKELRTFIKDTDTDELAKAYQTAPLLRNLTRRTGETLKVRGMPPPPIAPVTHHQKLAVFDGERLYVGGLDLNNRRFDDQTHDRGREETWHDVQVILGGPAAAEAQAHLLGLKGAVTGAPTETPKHILRTLSARRSVNLASLSPKPVACEIAQAHHDAIARATDLIYLETQFFRDTDLAKALAKRASQVPDLSVILMLPAAPEDIAFADDWGADTRFGEHLQAKNLDRLKRAFGDRLFIGTPAQPRRATPRAEVGDGSDRDIHYGAPIVYIHAKVSVFDTATGIISSANLNGRSLNWDTEVGVQTETPDEAAQIWERCVDHWIGPDAEPDFRTGATARKAWADLATANAARLPEDRRGFLLPYSIDAGRDDAANVPGLPEEMA